MSDKHLGLRIAGFILALLVAVGAFSFGVLGIGHKEEGYHDLTASTDQDALLYNSGIHATFLFRGSSSTIKLAIAGADKAYSEALKTGYKLLDPKVEYAGYVNLATLNHHPNEDIQVSPQLFAILTDAYAKTLEQRGYSIFAGPLYAEWESILILTEPEDFDPLVNEEERTRLEELRRRTGDLSQFRLVVVDADACIVRLEVSADYLAFLEDYELEATVIDLNLMREAYLLEMTGRTLAEQGYTEGYLSTDSGLILSLSGQKSGKYCIYGYADGAPIQAATADVKPGTAYCLFQAFSLTEGENAFYVLEKDGTIHLRNPYLPASGVDAELLLSSCVIREDGSLVEACYESICLRAAETPEALRRLARESDAAVALMLQGDEEPRVLVNAAAGELFVGAEEYGYHLEPLN